MNDLGLNLQHVRAWFEHEQDAPYILVRVSEEHAKAIGVALPVALRRCYIADPPLSQGSATPTVSQLDIIASKLPDAGSTMAGDFGEILVYLYQGTREHASVPLSVTKWRLKEDRRKPAPYSDVVHFVLPSWPASSPEDIILCAEVKTKSTKGTSTPIASAIADSRKDRTSRLANTLVWLRERALVEDLGDVQIEHLDRFIHATDHPPAHKRFQAVAVISTDLLAAELAAAPVEVPAEYTVVVVSIPQLHTLYTAVFGAARDATVETEAVLAV